MRKPHLLLVLPLLATGCRQIEPAPKELQALVQFFFTDFETAEDATMAEAFRNFDGVVDGKNLEYQEGFVDSLAKADTDATGYDHADPADAIGLFIVNPVECTMDQMVDLVTMKDQVGTYGTYESLDRTWVETVPEFKSGDSLTAMWSDDFHYTNGLLGIDYTATTEGSARWIPESEDYETPWGKMLVTRRVMVEPAVNAKDDHSYPQDWRTEIYYERSNGNIVHLAAMWREAAFGNLTHEDEIAQRTLLNGLKDWDEDSSDACAAR
jgi:hypothetical protein